MNGKEYCLCENTYCEDGSAPFYEVYLKEEYGGETEIWCKDCFEKAKSVVARYKLIK